MESVLVIDDEVGIRTAIQQVLQDELTQVHVESNSQSGVQAFTELGPNVVLLDIRLGNDSGIDTFRKIRQIDPRALVIFITGHGTTQLAIETMKMGAFDYLVKPLDLGHLQSIVRQAFKISQTMRMPAAVTQLESAGADSDRIVGGSRCIQDICKNIGRIAPQDINVLILGESGTGKELIARAIYHHSRRSNAAFLAINCAAIPENLLESELFGHEQGAFTGADRRRIGKFEQCHKGTIFLDEIGDMPLATQAKMLRLLQDGEIQRVGGNDVIRTDVRIVAATHQNLDSMIAKGLFRRDLYYRLRGVTIQLPPLRDRMEDIAELAHYFLFRFNPQLGTQVETISEEAIHRLQSYPWPGNIRELQSVIKQAMIASTGPTLLEEFLPEEVLVNVKLHEEALVEAQPIGPDAWAGFGTKMEETLEQKRGSAYRECIAEFDRILVQRVLRITEGNQLKAAEWLGISRPTLRSKLRAFLEKPTDSRESQ